MRVKQITAKGFKRFTDLTVSGLPETARLVVLVGPNGCGKSSLFDAMNRCARNHYAGINAGELGYYGKGFVPGANAQPQPHMTVDVQFHGGAPSDWPRAFHMRSAYRHVPTINASGNSGVNEIQHASNRLPRLTSHDTEIEANYRRLHAQAMDMLFEGGDTTAQQIIDSLTLPTRELLACVMPGLQLRSLENPRNNDRTFHFTKGEVDRYSYDNLSGGERAAFDLLLDMTVKRHLFPESVYCIDEPESHIGMGVQGELLRLMFDRVPENSQLWIGTHSIGMLRKATELASNHPGEVVFLDFSDKNFDQAVTLTPTEPNRAFWRKMHKVALNDLAALVAPDTIVICESGKGFDARCYNRIFSATHHKVQFASAGSKRVLEAVRLALKGAEIGAKLLTLRDMDHMTPEEVDSHRMQEGNRVLSRACIENYLLDDEVLTALCEKYGCVENLPRLKEIRDSEKNPKEAAGNIRTEMLRLSNNERIGDNREAFMEHTLAPLIVPKMKVYRELEADIFGTG